MAPRTRAAKVMAEILNEEAINTPLPPTPRVGQKERPPLGELSVVGENQQTPLIIDIASISKKSSRKKKHNKENLRKPEVLEDEYESSSSSAVEEARRELRSVHKNFVAPNLDTRPQTPPSRAVKAARRRLSPKSPCKTPRFDPEIHTVPQSARRPLQDDSFVAILEARSCSRMQPSQTIMEQVMEDVFVASSTVVVTADTVIPHVDVTTPDRNSRIEDSVQALDALTEALEELESSLPMIVNDTEVVLFKATTSSPEPKQAANTTKKRVSSAPVRKKPTTVLAQRQTIQLTHVKMSQPKVTTTDRKSSTTSRNQAPRPSIPATKRVFKPSPTSKGSVPGVASVIKAPFVPSRSTKAPTQSTFVLPGDAIRAKKQALHEAKLKKEGEEMQAKREFKARPVPARSSFGGATAPRPTIASQKRKSLAKGVDLASGNSLGNPVKKAVRSSSAFTNQSAVKPKTTIKSVVKVKTATKPIQRTSSATTKPPSISVSQLKQTPLKKPIAAVSTSTKPIIRKVSIKSIAGPKPAIPPSTKVVTHTKLLTDREKGEATKKARAEASERGRQASREWAEKERKKRQSLAELKANPPEQALNS